MEPLIEITQHPNAVSAAVAVGMAAAEAAVLVGVTTIYNHRELTHDSLKLGRVAKWIAQTALRAIGHDPNTWAAVHGDHHSNSDGDISTIIEQADFIKWVDAHPQLNDLTLPDAYPNLDPVAVLTREHVLTIGEAGRELIEGLYDPPTTYSDAETAYLIDTEHPRYLYDPRRNFLQRWSDRRAGVPQKEPPPSRSLQSLRYKLRDPHSPALHRYGVFGVWTDNLPLFRSGAAPYKDNSNRPERLRQDPAERIGRNQALGFTNFFLGNIAVSEAIHYAADIDRPVQALMVGAVAGGLAIGGLIFGGNTTNALGHAGERPLKAFWDSMIGRFRHQSVPPRVKPDGTFTTNEPILGPPTCDEAGLQENHHKRTDLIAYSWQKGIKKFKEAPFGTVVEWFARHHVLMEPGNNFKELTNAGKPRPDMPTRALQLLEAARRETWEEQQQALEPAA